MSYIISRVPSNMDQISHWVTWLCRLLAVITSSYAVATSTSEDGIISSSEAETQAGPEIYSLTVQTEVAFRFATTQVISRLANKAATAKEAVFVMTIPKTAFITSFVMTIDGKDYAGEVKEKLKAKQQYEKAKAKGESAGRVSAVQTRNTFQFRVAINVAAQNKVDFNLTYQELLERRLGYYEYVLNINPGNVVRDFRVDVYIRESREITEVKVPRIKRNATEVVDMNTPNPDASIMRDAKNQYHVLYDPDPDQQRRFSSNGIAGQLIVQYDIEREQNAGEIQVIDGYFVHYFAPSGLSPVNKNVLFVIDTSGSMYGDKIRQTKDAMHTILDDLREGDMFNIITFSSYVEAWSDVVKDVTPENVREAKAYVTARKPDGGTNINDALLRAISLLETERAREWEKKPSMIIFLTDGEPTSGITSLSRILSNVRKANKGSYTIFSLGFGQDLDFNFLQKISLQNRGLARRLYADSDATLQLEGFYNEVSTPVLSDIEISYVGDVIEPGYVTDVRYPAYYRGGEIIVAGKLKDGIRNLDSQVAGYASQGYMQFDTNVRIAKVEKEALQTAYSNFTERLWAYLTIRKLLDKVIESTNNTEKAAAKQRALDLSLKYQFVTPLTSMVVTKPEEPDKDISHLDDPDVDEDLEMRTPATDRNNAYYDNTPNTRSRSRNVRKYNRKTSFVDNDPHFIIHVSGIEEAVCFNVDGPPQLIYQLLHDKITGTVINAQVVGKDTIPKGHKYPRTYIGELMIMRNGVSVHITPRKVVLRGPDFKRVFRWRMSELHREHDVEVLVEERNKMFVSLGDNIVFAVLRHLVSGVHKQKVDFLGLYVVDYDGLSNYTHGLIGQFLYQEATIVPSNETPPKRDQAIVRLHGPHNDHRAVNVKQIRRRDMDRKDYVTCWNAKNNGKGLLIGKHSDYIVKSLGYSKHALLSKRMTRRVFQNRARHRQS